MLIYTLEPDAFVHNSLLFLKVFQRRIHEKVDFFLDWTFCVNGFGNKSKEF